MSSYQFIGLMYALVGLATAGIFAIEYRNVRSTDLQHFSLTPLATLVSRILVGLLFLYSGYVKANDYIGFGYKLEEYFEVFGEHFPALEGFFHLFIPISAPLAWFISVFEIALGVAIIVGWRMNLTMWLSMIMMVFFTLLTGYSHVTGAVTDCGCFGDALKIEPWESFVKDIILTGMLIPVFLVRKSIKPMPNARIAGILTGAAFLIAGIYSYYCHEHLPVVDYRPYKVGTDLEICTTEIPEGEDLPKCPDWAQFYEERPLFEGKVLMVIMYKFEKADEEAVKASTELASALSGSGVQIFGATNTSKSKMEETFISQYNLNYPFAYLDVKVLKTIVRSNPGYMLLKDGVVIKKWHHNDAPSAEEIKALVP